MEYRIAKEVVGGVTWYVVYEGHMSYGDWVKGEEVYQTKNITDCYSWVKIKQGGLFL